jgi:FixJ family two-component response regulator
MARKPLIVIVDDDESIRESLPDLLRQMGFRVRAFRSAEEFLAAVHVKRIDCLLIDVVMPASSGVDLHRELVRRGQTVPIVFMSASTDQLVAERSLAEGAVAFLVKPFSEVALREAIGAAVGRG